MAHQISTKQLKSILLTSIALAKAELSDTDFNKLNVADMQQYVMLIAECLPIEHMADETLIRHAFHQLIDGQTVEETVMHIFLLSTFRMTAEGSNHPLERGIIRQKIIGLLPIFEQSLNNGKISPAVYDKNADALSHIADSSGDVPEILEALSTEYLRYKKP